MTAMIAEQQSKEKKSNQCHKNKALIEKLKNSESRMAKEKTAAAANNWQQQK